MYKSCGSHWEIASEEDKESLSSSFWTDQESDEEQSECFVKDGSRGKGIEREPGINKQENKQGMDLYVKVNCTGTGRKLGEQEHCIKEDKQYYVKEHSKDQGTEKEVKQEREEECYTHEDSENDSIGINSGKDSIDNSSESKTESDASRSEEEENGDYVKEDSESSETENEQESEEEEDESLFKTEGKENELESYSVENEGAFDSEKEMDEKQKKSCAKNEETGSEDLSNMKEKEESDTNEFDKDEGTEKRFRNECKQSECVVLKDGMDSKVEEESESDVLESEEEIECFVSYANNDLMSCERLKRKLSKEELSHVSVNQSGIDSLVLKKENMSERLVKKPERQVIDIDEEAGGHFLNKYYTCNSIEEKWLDEESCDEHSKEEQDHNNTTYVMDEQHGNSDVQSDIWAIEDDAVLTELADQSYTKQEETNNGCTVIEQKRDSSVHQLENEQKKEEDGEKEVFDYYPDGMDSPTVSTLTSGYGTYRPDSPKDDLDGMDYKDDCTLTGLEEDIDYSNVVYCEGDDSQSVYQHSIFLEASEQQITSLSPQHNDENRHSSCEVLEENDQALYFAAEGADLSTRKETNGISSEDLWKSSHNRVYGSDEWETNYHHPFNIRLSKSVTIVEHTNEHGLAGQEKRKTKKAKSQFLKTEQLSELEERMDQLRVSASHGRRELDSESEETGSYSDRHSSATEELPSAFQAYIKSMGRSRSESDIRPRPKSFIRPVMDHPHTRNLRKTDPVAKYFQYKQSWELFKPPGEKSRKELHWAIREQLMYQPPPPKPQRTYVPNTYVVPTEKKRSALRWEIRHDLANGIIPTKITYP